MPGVTLRYLILYELTVAGKPPLDHEETYTHFRKKKTGKKRGTDSSRHDVLMRDRLDRFGDLVNIALTNFVSLAPEVNRANHTKAGHLEREQNVALLIYLGDRLNMVCASRLKERKKNMYAFF